MKEAILESERIQALRSIISGLRRLLVAYSGGIDSTLLAYLASLELDNESLAVTVVSPSLPARELAEAQAIALQFSIPHVIIPSREHEDPRYLENTPLRCYWCKQHIFSLLSDYASEHDFQFIADGSNLDDLNDTRPGRNAAHEYNIRSPLAEAQLPKTEVRLLARQLGLPNWNKPAAACLASRIPHGTPVSVELLNQIEQAESVIREFGVDQVRVRHHGDIARLEVDPADFDSVIKHSQQISQRLKLLGYRAVTLDLEGYQSGSLNNWIKEINEN